MRPRKLVVWRYAVGALVVGLVATACGGGGDSGSGEQEGPVTLTVSTFGSFGYEPLAEEYENNNPNVDVVLRKQEMQAHHDQLAQHLATGGGAADIEAIEVGFINQFRAQPENFVNLLDHGAGEIKDRWLDWKWQASMGNNGQYQIGLGTDVGGLAMCYRRDLFEQAGLPTDREEVSQLWPTWEEYIATGSEFQSSDVDAEWVDSATNVFNPVLRQQDTGFFNQQNELVMNQGPRQAWGTTMSVLQADLSANLTAFQPEWNTGFQQSQFATVICPAWMMANIKEQAADHEGKWDIADVPGPGGNWGGSYLAVPKQGDNVEEAYKLAAWLTAPEQQLKIFQDIGNLPSTPSLYDDPELANYTDPFFNDAPVGQIFTSSAQDFQPQYQGPASGDVRSEVENVIREVANGNVNPDQGWQQAVEAAQRVVED